MLHPGEVRVACGGRAVLPSAVAAKLIAASIAVIEQGVRNDEIRFKVFVRVV